MIHYLHRRLSSLESEVMWSIDSDGVEALTIMHVSNGSN